MEVDVELPWVEALQVVLLDAGAALLQPLQCAVTWVSVARVRGVEAVDPHPRPPTTDSACGSVGSGRGPGVGVELQVQEYVAPLLPEEEKQGPDRQ